MSIDMKLKDSIHTILVITCT